MKKRMRFLAVAALSVAMTTAFGQAGTQGSTGSGSSGSSGSGVYQQDQSGQSGQSGQGSQGSSGSYGTGSQSQGQSGQSGTTRQGQTGTQSQGTQSKQSGQGSQSQGMGAGSAEARVKSEVQWMKSEFNLTDSQEQRLHEVLLKYETQSATGGDVNKNEKEKEIKAIIGDDNYKIYKEKKDDKDKTKSGSSQQR